MNLISPSYYSALHWLRWLPLAVIATSAVLTRARLRQAAFRQPEPPTQSDDPDAPVKQPTPRGPSPSLAV